MRMYPLQLFNQGKIQSSLDFLAAACFQASFTFWGKTPGHGQNSVQKTEKYDEFDSLRICLANSKAVFLAND